MADKGWRSKGDKVLRRSPRKKGKTCGRPFSAPRKVREPTPKTPKIFETKEAEDSDIRVLSNSEVQMIVSMQDIFPEVQMITETENQRDLRARLEAQNDGSDSEEDIPFSTLLRQEKEVQERPEIEIHSDTTGSTPEIFKSPVREVMERHVAKATSPALPYSYEGPTFIPETEQQDISPGIPETEQQGNSVILMITFLFQLY
jgi:hypothetical protein